MICNTRKLKEIEIDGAKFFCRPLTTLQKVELAEVSKHEDNDQLQAVYKGVEYLFNNSIENTTGLKDYEGCEVDFESVNKKELAEGLEISSATAIINALLEISTLTELDKKKLSQQAQSGTE